MKTSFFYSWTPLLTLLTIVSMIVMQTMMSTICTFIVFLFAARLQNSIVFNIKKNIYSFGTLLQTKNSKEKLHSPSTVPEITNNTPLRTLLAFPQYLALGLGFNDKYSRPLLQAAIGMDI